MVCAFLHVVTQRNPLPMMGLVALLATACGGHEYPLNDPSQAQQAYPPGVSHTAKGPTGDPVGPAAGTTNMMPATGTVTSTSPPTSANPGQTSEAPLTDQQILAVAHDLDRDEIARGKLALSKSRDSRVRTFASAVIWAHSEADAKADEVAEKAHLNPAVSATGATLEDNARTATQSLEALGASAFDRGYVDDQIAAQQTILDLIDQKLILAAQTPDLVAFLQDLRSKATAHLQRARDLRRALLR